MIQWKVISTSLNVRQNPNTNSPKITEFVKGDTIVTTDEYVLSGLWRWRKLYDSDGWVAEGTTSLFSEYKLAARYIDFVSNEPEGNELEEVAQQQLFAKGNEFTWNQLDISNGKSWVAELHIAGENDDMLLTLILSKDFTIKKYEVNPSGE